MKSDYKEAVKTAEDYYNSTDANAFYAAIWGGEDIHVGLYESDGEDIAEASARTVRHMASKLDLKPGARVIDIGAGYGGAARYLARETGAPVTCLNLSEIENARNRKLTAEQGLEDKVEVVHGVFEEIPSPRITVLMRSGSQESPPAFRRPATSVFERRSRAWHQARRRFHLSPNPMKGRGLSMTPLHTSRSISGFHLPDMASIRILPSHAGRPRFRTVRDTEKTSPISAAITMPACARNWSLRATRLKHQISPEYC